MKTLRRAWRNLPIFLNWPPKNIPDQKKRIFQKLQKVLSHSTLLKRKARKLARFEPGSPRLVARIKPISPDYGIFALDGSLLIDDDMASVTSDGTDLEEARRWMRFESWLIANPLAISLLPVVDKHDGLSRLWWDGSGGGEEVGGVAEPRDEAVPGPVLQPATPHTQAVHRS